MLVLHCCMQSCEELSASINGLADRDFSRSRARRLPEAAAERLRTPDHRGRRWRPGARLNERELSERLGVSRTPLREAFRMLAADGLLVQLPNRGAQVVALSRDDVRHAFEVMARSKGWRANSPAAARDRRRPRRAARAAGARWRQAHARHDLPAYYRVNRAIHDRINAIAGNPMLDARPSATLNTRLHALRFRSNLDARQMGSGGGANIAR